MFVNSVDLEDPVVLTTPYGKSSEVYGIVIYCLRDTGFMLCSCSDGQYRNCVKMYWRKYAPRTFAAGDFLTHVTVGDTYLLRPEVAWENIGEGHIMIGRALLLKKIDGVNLERLIKIGTVPPGGGMFEPVAPFQPIESYGPNVGIGRNTDENKRLGRVILFPRGGGGLKEKGYQKYYEAVKEGTNYYV